MAIHILIPTFSRWLLLAILFAIPIGAVPVGTLSAQDSAVVRLLQNPEMIERLNLDMDQANELNDLLKQRGEGLIQLRDALKNAPEKLRNDKVTEYQQQTETKSLALLSEDQKGELDKLMIGQQGFSALANNDIAKQLRLTDEQQTAIADILTERDEKTAGLSAEDADGIKLAYEIRLEKILEAQQLQGWRVLTGEIDEKAAAEDLLANLNEPGEPVTDNPGDEPTDETTETKPVRKVFDPDKKLSFSFGDEDWKVVIEWFAEQANLNLKIESLPEGTLSYNSEREYSLQQGMDFLNNQLLAQDHTLIRYDDLLTVVNLANGIPPSVIETITPEELDDRGKYEIVKVAFEFINVNGAEFSEEIKPLINTEKGQGDLLYFPSSNRMIVQETGGTLRSIRSILDIAEKRQARLKGKIERVELKYVTAEELLIVVRQIFGMPEGENSIKSEEGRLSIVPEALGNRLWVDGTPEMVERFIAFVDEFDVEGDPTEIAEIEATRILKYRTKADPVIAEQILRRMFGAEQGMRLARDENTGFILIEGTPDQHDMVVKAIAAIDGEASVTKVVDLTRKDAADVIDLLTSLLQIQTDETGNPIGTLVLQEDPDENRIIVRGTPQEVIEVEEMIATMDPPIGSVDYDRSELRVIPFSPSGAARALESSSQIWNLMERSNSVKYIVPGKGEFDPANPDELKKMLGREEVIVPSQPKPDSTPVNPQSNRTNPTDIVPLGVTVEELQKMFPDQDFGDLLRAIEKNTETLNKSRQESSRSQTQQPKQPTPNNAQPNNAAQPKPAAPTPAVPKKSDASDSNTTIDNQNTSLRKQTNIFQVAAVVTRPQTGTTVANPQTRESTETPPTSAQSETEQAAPKISIPGAPITVQVTRSEILLYSKDLDALDEWEQLLTQSESSFSSEEPVVFLLEHRSPEEAKGILEEVLGISGGSGGSGLMGGMMGGMAQNMLGGPAGDMVSNLLGSGGGSSNVLRTYGDVTIVADPQLGGLIIYAIDEDLDQIQMLLKIIDQEAPHDPRLDGKTYVIPIVHVDAEDLVEIVKEQLAARIKSAQATQGQQQQQGNPAEMLKALMGRGGRGGRGGGGGVEIADPKFAITAYTQANWILVTGPEFLYRQVNDIILMLDTEQALAQMPSPAILPKTGISPEFLEEALKAAFGEQIETEVVPSGSGNSRSPNSSNNGAPSGRSSSDEANAAMRAAFIERMRSGGFGGFNGGRPNFGGGGPGGDRGGSRGGR